MAPVNSRYQQEMMRRMAHSSFPIFAYSMDGAGGHGSTHSEADGDEEVYEDEPSEEELKAKAKAKA